MNCIFNWDENKPIKFHKPVGNDKTVLKKQYSSGIRILMQIFFRLQTFLNALPDFIPIVFTAEKYLLKIQCESKIL
jgi:hypothetical protein